ncbi:MAG: hypothetical protein PHT60_13895 [Acidiphilium sp.]|nr:hypothetical protein [Acidiphilium sp.]MDD4936857.1 hypothetical protein [Acidiphilium sp.]
MTTAMKTCTNWRNHVTLTCPALTEMLTIVNRIETDDADWLDLEAKTVAWMSAMIDAMAPFMTENELDRMIERLIGMLYVEAMRAGDAYHRSTKSLFGQPAKSEAEHQAFLAALIAGGFRVAFEAAHRTSTGWLRLTENDSPAPIAASVVSETVDAPAMQTG